MGILKLNLLPAYLAERRKTLGMVKFMVIVVVAAAGISVAWVVSANARVATATRELADATAKANAVLEIEKNAKAISDQQPAFRQWVTWYAQVNQQGEKFVTSLEAINAWLFKDIEITQLSVRGNAVNFDGRARNLEAMKTFYLQMKAATPYAGPPQVQYQIAGWTVAQPPDDTRPVAFRVQGTLKEQYVLAMPAIPQKTIALSGSRGGTAISGAGGGLGPTGASSGSGGPPTTTGGRGLD